MYKLFITAPPHVEIKVSSLKFLTSACQGYAFGLVILDPIMSLDLSSISPHSVEKNKLHSISKPYKYRFHQNNQWSHHFHPTIVYTTNHYVIWSVIYYNMGYPPH